MCIDHCASRPCPANSLLFTVHSCLSNSSKCISTAQARRIWVSAAGASNDCARMWCRAHFRTWWSLFVAGAGETSCFGASKSTFRDRCKGSELFYFEMQFSWPVQHIEQVGDRQELRFVTGAANRDFWTCGSFADFVAGTALCDPRCADFVAGAALCEPRSADFVTRTALCEPRSADFVAGAALW